MVRILRRENDESKAEFAVTSYSNYKNSNAASGDFNKQK